MVFIPNITTAVCMDGSWDLIGQLFNGLETSQLGTYYFISFGHDVGIYSVYQNFERGERAT
jgi:hypothetical protein